MLLTTGASAQNLGDETVGDLRCMVVAMRMSESENPVMRASGSSAMMYFLGRLDGHAPNANLEQGLADAVTTMTAEDFAAEGRRCGQIMIDRGKALTAAGEGLIRRGEKAQQERNSL